VTFVAFLVLGYLSKSVIRRFSVRRQRGQGVTILLGRLSQTIVVVVGFLIAFSVVAPSFHAGDLIKMLGIGSVAIGFAFQNILQNFLVGILILLHEPFRLNDVISVTGIEGKVDDIQARATIVTTTEGRQVFIPNATLFTNPVAVSPSGTSTPGAPRPQPQAVTMEKK
jgi:small conductance mechanosensitive channel